MIKTAYQRLQAFRSAFQEARQNIRRGQVCVVYAGAIYIVGAVIFLSYFGLPDQFEQE